MHTLPSRLLHDKKATMVLNLYAKQLPSNLYLIDALFMQVIGEARLLNFAHACAPVHFAGDHTPKSHAALVHKETLHLANLTLCSHKAGIHGPHIASSNTF
jgi:hypothetical protein